MFYNKKKQRWSLRKLSVGLASIMLGVTFVTTSQSAHASTTNTVKEENVTNNDKQQLDANNKISQVLRVQQETKTPNLENKVTTFSQTPVNNNVALEKSDKEERINTTKGIQKSNDQTNKQLNNQKQDSKISNTQAADAKNKEQTGNTDNEIIEKYNKLLDSIANDKWQSGSGWESVAVDKRSSEKKETEVSVEPSVDNPYPTVNTKLTDPDENEYSFVYDHGNTSRFGWSANAGGGDLYNNGRIITNSYKWINKDKSIVINHHIIQRVNYTNGGGTKEIVKKDDDGREEVSYPQSSGQEIDVAKAKFDINENMILTADGEVIHKIVINLNIKLEDETYDNEFSNFQTYILLDTSLQKNHDESNDGVQLHSAGKGENALYITKGNMMYGIRGLGDSTVFVSDYSKNTSSAGSIEDKGGDVPVSKYGEDEVVKDATGKEIKDTAIRIVSPKGDKNAPSTIWYMEVPVVDYTDEDIKKVNEDWKKERGDVKKDLENPLYGLDPLHRDDNNNNPLKNLGDDEKDSNLSDDSSTRFEGLMDGTGSVLDEVSKSEDASNSIAVIKGINEFNDKAKENKENQNHEKEEFTTREKEIIRNTRKFSKYLNKISYELRSLDKISIKSSKKDLKKIDIEKLRNKIHKGIFYEAIALFGQKDTKLRKVFKKDAKLKKEFQKNKKSREALRKASETADKSSFLVGKEGTNTAITISSAGQYSVPSISEIGEKLVKPFAQKLSKGLVKTGKSLGITFRKSYNKSILEGKIDNWFDENILANTKGAKAIGSGINAGEHDAIDGLNKEEKVIFDYVHKIADQFDSIIVNKGKNIEKIKRLKHLSV